MQALIDYIEGGHSQNDFLDDFPTVTREIAVAALEQAKAHLIADARAAWRVVTHIHDWYASINLVLPNTTFAWCKLWLLCNLWLLDVETGLMYKKISFRSVPKLGSGNRAEFFIARTRLKSRYAANAAPMSSGGTRRKRARATSGCGWSAWLRKARRTLTTASFTFRGGAKHACCRACYGPVRGAVGFAFSQPIQIDDEGSL
jgi:hypothetical protein